MSETIELVKAEKQWLDEMISTNLLKNNEFIKKYTESTANTFHVQDIQIKFIGIEEAFMLTVCYHARITFEFRGSTEVRFLVVKKTPVLPQETFDTVNFGALFGNEIQAYKTIMPAFVKIAGNNFNLTKLYYGEVRTNFAATIMEDFTANGWRLSKAFVNISLDHILITVKYLARFHACGFAMRLTKRECFDKLISLLKEARYAKSTVHEDYFIFSQVTGIRLQQATQQYQPTVPIEFAQRLNRMQQSYHLNNKKRVAPIEPIVTLCHGDFLRNNIAFKYEDAEHEIPVDIMMFDFQTLRLGSPMMDLVLFLGLATYAEVRYKNFDLIFNTYCEQLAASFKTYAPNEVMPSYLRPEVLIKEFIRLLPYSISTASNFLPIISDPEKDLTREELLTRRRTLEEIKEEAMTRGGNIVSKELAHQVKELYDLAQKHGVDVFAGCDY